MLYNIYIPNFFLEAYLKKMSQKKHYLKKMFMSYESVMTTDNQLLIS